jgi:hypothetical protein
MNKTWLLAVLFALAFIVILVYSTIGLGHYRVEVCVTYRGRTSCRTAAASSKEQALRAATDNACAFLTSGMTDSMTCASTPPSSVRWLNEN